MGRNCIIIIILCCISFIIGRCSHKEITVEETITRDTIRVFNSSPSAIHTTIHTIKVPCFVSIPNDTIVKERLIVDSVMIDAPFERVEYKDSTLYAIVSGVSIGGIRPSLEYYETYNTTTTRVEHYSPPLLSPYASIMVGYNSFGGGIGVFIREKHGIGVDYVNINGCESILGRYSFKF